MTAKSGFVQLTIPKYESLGGERIWNCHKRKTMQNLFMWKWVDFGDNDVKPNKEGSLSFYVRHHSLLDI